MQQPAFKPDTWVIYKVGQATYMGKIVGGRYDEEKNEWRYSIHDGRNIVEAAEQDVALVK